MSDFVHLHCHTEYSLLDGAIKLKDLCKTAKDFGMESVAITDHGNLFGALDFYSTAKSFGLKPIIGCEVYMAHTDRFDRTSPFARTRYHLILLAQNIIGYKNLIKLVTAGFTEGMYYKPRIDKKILAEHSEGLIALSACLAGEIPRILMKGQQQFYSAEEFGEASPETSGLDGAIEMAKIYSNMFPGRFYLELQDNGLKEQTILNTKLLELAEATKLPVVATNDCHYLTKDDVEAHDLLLCIQTQHTIHDPKRMRFETRELYYKTPEEMEASFSHIPEALENTMRIAEECNLELEFGKYHFPAYAVPKGNTLDSELRSLSRKRLTERIASAPHRNGINEEEYKIRLEHELDVICEMGFAGYFLIVQDFINWAKEKHIPVGPGRGSAAGSLVAWALKITDIDPIPYNLLFERFLNSERISMPDIDVDFCERRRGEVIAYVAEKYGSDSVAQITTFGKMKAKAVVRDVGRALGMSFGETDRIAKLIPEELNMTINKALDLEPELMRLCNSDENIKKLIDISIRLEGLNRHASTHAAGVVISDRPMVEYLPLYKGKKDETVTQFDMKMVEKVGLIKFDFLGLRTMTLVQDTIDIIVKSGKTPPNLETLPLNDAAVYDLYSRGDTYGIFQVESAGMRRYLKDLRPTVFEDIIAMLALYRPGPLGSGMVEEFIARKQGKSPIKYPLPELKECLGDTYGVIVYQEQVMQIAQIVGNYTLGGADLLRRAMGKKNIEEMASQRVKFVSGAKEHGVTESNANEIFDLMEKFAEYGFNKSHSAAYALISYYTAYLKAHFPTEFMAALLTSEMGNQDKLLQYVSECKNMNIYVLQPDIKLSEWTFTAHDNKIIFGLGGIKNLGEEAVKELVSEREKNGPFSSLLDFCLRLDSKKINKRALEGLAKGGAFDSFGLTRSTIFNALQTAVAKAQKKIKDEASNHISMLGMLSIPKPKATATPGLGFDYAGSSLEEWTDNDKLQFEKEALGFYLTSHPLQYYWQDMRRINSYTIEEARTYAPGTPVRMAALITHIKEYINKKGEKMAFCQMEDLTGTGECTFLPKEYEQFKSIIHSEMPTLLLEGKIDSRQFSSSANASNDDDDENSEEQKELKLTVTGAKNLANECEQSTEPVVLNLPVKYFNSTNLSALKNIFQNHQGKAPLEIYFEDQNKKFHLQIGEYNIKSSLDFRKNMDDWYKHCENTMVQNATP